DGRHHARVALPHDPQRTPALGGADAACDRPGLLRGGGHRPARRRCVDPAAQGYGTRRGVHPRGDFLPRCGASTRALRLKETRPVDSDRPKPHDSLLFIPELITLKVINWCCWKISCAGAAACRPWLHAGNKKAPLGAFGVARQVMPALSAMVGRDGFEPSTKRLKVFCSTD